VELLYNLFMNEFLTQNNDMILKLGVAVVLGMLIGVQRLFVNRAAGMKTHALVALGAASFVVISEMLANKYSGVGGFDPSRIASQIVVGIGFLGAGSIILRDNKLLGLTTASGLWVTAAIGMAAGFGFFNLAVISTALVLFVLTVVYFLERPIKNIRSKPEDEQ
jgi:putative Mg2+ transporter-C (MgtC) family protein